MELTCNAGDLEDIAEVLKIHAWDGIIQVKQNGLRLQVKETANVIFLDIEIGSEFFDKFEPEIERHREDDQIDSEDGLFYLGLHFTNFHSFVSRLNGDEAVTLSLEDSKLMIQQGSTELSLPVLSLDPDDIPDTDSLTLETRFKVVAEEFVDTLKTLALVEAPVNVDGLSDRGAIKLSAESSQGSVDTELDYQDWRGEGAKGMFSESYMADVSKTVKKMFPSDDLVEFRIDSNRPMALFHDSEDVKTRIYVAPRIPEK